MKRTVLLHILIIACLGVLVYSNTFHSPFVFDDEPNILQNAAIRDFQYFRHPSQITAAPIEQGVKNLFLSRYIGYLSFALNYQVHGYTVYGYHLLNLVIHIINGVLVYLLIHAVFRTPFAREFQLEKGMRSGISLFSALLFVSHPIQTQAVTYIVQRFASLSALWYLLCLVFYLQSRHTEKPVKRFLFYTGSLLACLLAMKTKEIAFTLPVMVVLLELMFYCGNTKRRLFLLIPFALTMLIIPLTMIYTAHVMHQAIGTDSGVQLANQVHNSSAEYLLTESRVIITYLRLFFPPVIQNLDYDFRLSHSFFEPSVLLSFSVITGIIGSAFYLLFRSRKADVPSTLFNRLTAFGIFWFFVTLSIESSIIPISDVIFEHRLYLPSVGFFLVAVVTVVRLKNRLTVDMPGIAKIIFPVSVIVVLFFSAAAYARNTVWQSDIRLWEDVSVKSPLKARPHNNLGLAYQKRYRQEDALKEFRIVAALKPDYEGVYLNIGSILYDQGRYREALTEYRKVLDLKTDSYKAHNNIGLIYFQQGKYDSALEEYRTALQIKPGYAEAHNSMGALFLRQKEYDLALKEFRLAIDVWPDYPEAHNNLATVLHQLGENEQSIQEFRIVAKLVPDYIGVYIKIGNIYRELGRPDEALNQYNIALSIKPDYQEAMENIRQLKSEQDPR